MCFLNSQKTALTPVLLTLSSFEFKKYWAASILSIHYQTDCCVYNRHRLLSSKFNITKTIPQQAQDTPLKKYYSYQIHYYGFII